MLLSRELRLSPFSVKRKPYKYKVTFAENFFFPVKAYPLMFGYRHRLTHIPPIHIYAARPQVNVGHDSNASVKQSRRDVQSVKYLHDFQFEPRESFFFWNTDPFLATADYQLMFRDDVFS